MASPPQSVAPNTYAANMDTLRLEHPCPLATLTGNKVPLNETIEIQQPEDWIRLLHDQQLVAQRDLKTLYQTGKPSTRYDEHCIREIENDYCRLHDGYAYVYETRKAHEELDDRWLRTQLPSIANSAQTMSSNVWRIITDRTPDLEQKILHRALGRTRLRDAIVFIETVDKQRSGGERETTPSSWDTLSKALAGVPPTELERHRATKGCLRCGRKGHQAFSCHATKTIAGSTLITPSNDVERPEGGQSSGGSSKESGKAPKGQGKKDSGSNKWGSFKDALSGVAQAEIDNHKRNPESCLRCGRTGHRALACHAATTIEGTDLPKVPRSRKMVNASKRKRNANESTPHPAAKQAKTTMVRVPTAGPSNDSPILTIESDEGEDFC
jgi:hypothetical protein